MSVNPLQRPTPELVTAAYRLLLGREPDSPAHVADKCQRLADRRELLLEFLECSEFRAQGLQRPMLSMLGDEPPMHVQVDGSSAELDALQAHVAASWDRLGRTEPHWSVLSAERFRQANLAGNEEAFYASGEPNVRTLWAMLRRNGVEPAGIRDAIELGCGLGRITRWLAPPLRRVIGLDISPSHLAAAADYLKRVGVSNVELRRVRSIADLEALPQVDLVYSVIVLQHNPPPVIAATLRALLAAVAPGGACVFQVPTYRRAYQFDIAAYLRGQGRNDGIEMHVLPQSEVFRIAREAGMDVLEVLEDSWAGPAPGHRSNTFVLRRPG